MYNTYNYINILRRSKVITKKDFNIKLLFLLNLKTTNKTNIILTLLLLKYCLPKILYKINTRNNILYFFFNNLLQYKEWFKYFLKNKLLKKKLKKISTLFFLYNLQILQYYRKINYSINYYNINFNKFITKYHLIFK